MAHKFSLGGVVTLPDLAAVVNGGRLSFGGAAKSRVAAARKRLMVAAASGEPIYGVNTGFAELASRRIPNDQPKDLQRNLVHSHACGVGPLLEEEAGILFLRQ